MNAIVFEERRGRGQKVVAYSDIVNDDTMISPTIIVYYKYKGDFFNILENDNLFHFYYSLKRENNLLDTISFRASSRLLIFPPLSLLQRLFHSFLLEPKHRK